MEGEAKLEDFKNGEVQALSLSSSVRSRLMR